jgi:hypothetical protein
MLKEIHEQPRSINDSIRGRMTLGLGTVRMSGVDEHEDRWNKATRILIVACGTSWHAGLVAEYLFEEFTRHGRDYDRLTFSVSPKLPCSGESWDKAINPKIIKEYESVGMTYLKFVVGNEQDLRDVDRAVEEFRSAGFGGPVYLMPIGGVPGVYNLNTQEVAKLAMKRGYRYSPRLQVDIWRNAWGT